MLTDTRPGPTDARNWLLWGVAWSLALFGLLRLPWTEARVLLPFVRAQGGAAMALFGAPAIPVEVTLACSGADALALCLAAVVAYPVPWRARLAGAAGAGLLIGTLNILRIGSLGRAAASPAWFDTLHLYVWPAVLTLSIAGYALAWMGIAYHYGRSGGDGTPSRGDGLAASPPRPSRKFVILTGAFLLVFSLASPLYLESAGVLALATSVARAAAIMLGALGIAAYASANVLVTPRGGFLVTQECISTPLIPIYLAAVAAYAPTWRRTILAVLATVPLFWALGVARLLVVSLPEAVGPPLFLMHAFYQLLLGAVVVFMAALWRHGRTMAIGRGSLGVVAGTLFAVLLGGLYTHALTSVVPVPRVDPQGAAGLLPAFQIALYLALWVAAFVSVSWPRVFAGLAVLAITQAGGLAVLHALDQHDVIAAQVTAVRGWAVAGPVLVFAVVLSRARPHR